MRRRRIFCILLVIAILFLTACHLPELPDGSSELICRITEKEEKTLKVEVLNSDSHYDAEQTLLVQYNAISGGTSVAVGDTISFTYYYLQDVTVRDKLPCITVSTVALTQWTPQTTQTGETGEN